MSNEKIYCGSGKEKFNGDLISVSICLDQIPSEHINEYNGKRYVRLNVQKKQKEDQYGKTHGVSIDTWRPDAKPNNENQSSYQSAGLEEDIPF